MVPCHDKIIHIKDHDHTPLSSYVDIQICIRWAPLEPILKKVGVNQAFYASIVTYTIYISIILRLVINFAQKMYMLNNAILIF